MKSRKMGCMFSVICDECTDSANKEQLSLLIWYVANERICESFVGFFELNEEVTCEAIAGTIEQAIAECSLDTSLLRGHAYDGVSNMSRKYKDCATILKEKYPLGIYSHCCSHALNLVVVNICTCGSIHVQNLFAIAGKVYRFFDNHPKHQYLLKRFCEGSSTKVKLLCKTRWLQQIDALHVFMDLFDNIIKALDYVVTNSSS